MSKILNKVREFLKNGETFTNIAENIILNYSSCYNNDLVYKIKKQISTEFNVELMHVHLIGSSHTGFSKSFIEKEGKDYDFCIVDSKVFQVFLLKINLNEISKKNINFFHKNLANGKIHYHYINHSLKNELSSKLNKIRKVLNIEKEISICIYISEEAFIKNVASFWEKQWIQTKTTGRATIDPLPKIGGGTL
ncbi:hypothetical protein MWG07_11640 [Fusobacterium necrophorum]|uniref:Uncharacterized protein n=2 Tax=Fusobacterium necrophorum TaxID=859 RepID=A0AAW6WE02_9FUSO|nr:hypothetical protein [Fusobacterium necrophorum]KYM42951.1 hypothetical protein A2U15_08510 [Fusobacterium necrophorum subsp. funduliforme]KYM57602.1 hypothetical protein A2U07_08735 [Fusobacterium necrophorum subsp. funduliforme]MDK4512901.1 hypothetical protein [Fusobacterium necrophorum]MDK4515703.1 hypothetical protein [Fusobacterium necrophorum]